MHPQQEDRASYAIDIPLPSGVSVYLRDQPIGTPRLLFTARGPAARAELRRALHEAADAFRLAHLKMIREDERPV